MSRAGLKGLTRVLKERTAVEPGEPIAIDIESDELAFFPLIYWPVTTAQAQLSAQALAKVDTFMRNGGTILFDTRDQDTALPTAIGRTANGSRHIAPSSGRSRHSAAAALDARTRLDANLLFAARISRPLGLGPRLDRSRTNRAKTARPRRPPPTKSRRSSSAAPTGPRPGRRTTWAARLPPSFPAANASAKSRCASASIW